jgi:hypothetical protein
MCANHAKCSPEGQCDWTGDYGSYQAHIRTCQNIPTRCGLSSAPENVATLAVASDKLESYALPQAGGGKEAPEHDIETVSVVSETTVDPISADASEASDSVDPISVDASEASDCDEAPMSPPNGDYEEMLETASSSEPASVEASTLNQLISEFVALKLKEHQQHCEVKETHAVAESHDDDASHATAMTQLCLGEAASSSNKKSVSKKIKKPKQNQEAAPSNAAQQQAAQMAHWQAAQMAQWRHLQAAQVAHWQAYQARVAHMQAAQVQQWRMAQSALAAQYNQAAQFA